MKLSPLNDLHEELGAKMVEFAGWSKIEIMDSQKNLQRWYTLASTRPSVEA